MKFLFLLCTAMLVVYASAQASGVSISALKIATSSVHHGDTARLSFTVRPGDKEPVVSCTWMADHAKDGMIVGCGEQKLNPVAKTAKTWLYKASCRIPEQANVYKVGSYVVSCMATHGSAEEGSVANGFYEVSDVEIEPMAGPSGDSGGGGADPGKSDDSVPDDTNTPAPKTDDGDDIPADVPDQGEGGTDDKGDDASGGPLSDDAPPQAPGPVSDDDAAKGPATDDKAPPSPTSAPNTKPNPNPSPSPASDCRAGTFADTNGCTACGAGTFAQAGSKVCTPCAAGKYSYFMSAKCTACEAGTYAQKGQGACTMCPSGSYSASGAGKCSTCANGYFSGPGATQCDSCSS